MDNQKLSARVEAHSGGDSWSLRIEIAEALGWTSKPVGGVIAWYAPEESGNMKAGPPKWLTSLGAAMSLVPEGYAVNSIRETTENEREEHTGDEPLPLWSVTLVRRDCTGYKNRKKFAVAFQHGNGPTPALALCATALKAQGL